MSSIIESNIRSSCVKAAIYDICKKELSITYPSGKTYDYLNVPRKVFDELEKAPSAGRFLNFEIKPVYACRACN